MKTIRRFISVVITFALFFAIIPINHIHADGNINITENDHATLVNEEKIYSEATLEDDFADDKVIVILKHDVSMEFKSFTTSDFPQINAVAVTDLTYATGQMVKAKVLGANVVMNDGNIAKSDNEINVDAYRQIIAITLAETGKDKVLEAVRTLEIEDNIMYVGPDFYLTMELTEAEIELPTDLTSIQTDSTEYTRYPNEYSGWDMSWYARDLIELPKAWYYEYGSRLEQLTIGIIDSGIQGDHPDLSANLVSSLHKSFISTTDNPLVDEADHGTRVASIIGAKGNNCTTTSGSMVGVCWDVSMISLKAFEYDANTSNAVASVTRIVNAITYANMNSIDVLYCNYGTYSMPNADHASLLNAIETYGGLIVCPAGDNSINTDTEPYYPSSFELPNLISVGACDPSDDRCSFSNYGNTTVDLFAPGEPVYTCSSDGSCIGDEGVEYAAAFVAGAAILLKICNPGLTTYELKDIIMQSVDQNDNYDGYCTTGGRLNVYKAILRALMDTDLIQSDDHICDIEYYSNNYATHSVCCVECSFYYFDAHIESELNNGRTICTKCSRVMHTCTYVYTSLNNLYHKTRCTGCNHEFDEAHIMQVNGSRLICTKCGYSSISIMYIEKDEEDE